MVSEQTHWGSYIHDMQLLAGVGDVIGGYVLGAISDGCSGKKSAGCCRKLIVTLGAVCYGLALGLTYFQKQEVSSVLLGDIMVMFCSSLVML